MTAQQARAALGGAEPHVPEPPQPLRRVLPPADPFPLDALGRYAEAAEAVHDRSKAPVATCCQSVLATLTLAAQALVNVRLPTGDDQPTSDYYATVSESGERKTTADNIAFAAVRQHEIERRDQYELDNQSYTNATAADTARRERIRKDKNKAPDEIQAELDALGLPPPPPAKPSMVTTDATIEGLEHHFANSGSPSYGLYSNEGGKFLGGHSLQKDRKVHAAASYNSLWDCGETRRLRVKEGEVVLYGRRFSIHIMLQPGLAVLLLTDPTLKDLGFTSRLLLTAPDPLAGTRLWAPRKPETDLALRRYYGRILDLLRRPLPVAADRPCELKPRALGMDEAATREWIRFYDHTEAMVGPGRELVDIKSLTNKIGAHVARLGGVFAVGDDLDAGTIHQRHVEAGIALAEHFLAEALRLGNPALADPTVDLAEMLRLWLLLKWEHPLVSLPDVYQRGPNTIGNKQTALALVSLLERHGWLIRVPGGAEIDGTRRRDVWRILGKGP